MGGERVEARPAPSEYRGRGRRHAAAWVFYGIFFGVIAGQGPFVIRRLGGTALQCMALSIAQGLVLLPALLWMPYVERRNPVRLTGLVLCLAGAFALLSGFAQTTAGLSAVLAVALALAALHQPTLGVALERVYPREWRGQLMSLPNTVDMVVRVIVLVGVGRLLTWYLGAYQWIFPAAGASLIAGGAIFRGIGGSRGARRPEGEGAGPAERAGSTLRRALANRTLLMFLVGYFFVTSGGILFGQVLPLFANDELMLTPEQWGIATGAALVTTLASLWFWGRFMDRFGAPATMVVTWAGIGVLSGALFAVHSWPPFLVLLAARGLLLSGNLLAFFPIVMHFTDRSETAQGMGLHGSLWGLRWVVMPLIVAIVVDGRLFPMRYVFLLSVGLMAAGVVVMAHVWRRDPAGRAPAAP